MSVRPLVYQQPQQCFCAPAMLPRAWLDGLTDRARGPREPVSPDPLTSLFLGGVWFVPGSVLPDSAMRRSASTCAPSTSGISREMLSTEHQCSMTIYAVQAKSVHRPKRFSLCAAYAFISRVCFQSRVVGCTARYPEFNEPWAWRLVSRAQSGDALHRNSRHGTRFAQAGCAPAALRRGAHVEAGPRGTEPGQLCTQHPGAGRSRSLLKRDRNA
jgi:hypothetical protein